MRRRVDPLVDRHRLVPWWGGKWRLAPTIVDLLPYPPHARTYVEPFAGGAAVFWRKPPHPIEILNDRNEWIVTVYRVLRDPERYRELAHRLQWTAYARSEFELAIRVLLETPDADDVTRAWAYVVFCQQCRLGGGVDTSEMRPSNWGYSIQRKQADVYFACTDHRVLAAYHRRLRSASIECLDALDVIDRYDHPATVFYFDPPYPSELVMHDYYVGGHRVDEMLTRIARIRGYGVLSFPPHDSLAILEREGWELREVTVQYSQAARGEDFDRTEIIALSPRLRELHDRGGAMPLFRDAAREKTGGGHHVCPPAG